MTLEITSEWQRPEYWRTLAPGAFESEVALLYRACGWQTQHCGQARDGGIDVKMQKTGCLAYVQCKRYADPVGVAAVREINGVARADGAKPVVVATAGYTPDAIEFARKAGVQLLAVEDLVRLAREAEPAWQEEMRRKAEEAAEYKARYEAEFPVLAAEARIRDERIDRERRERDAEIERGKQEWLRKHQPKRVRERTRPIVAKQIKAGDVVKFPDFGPVRIQAVEKVDSEYFPETSVVFRWSTGVVTLNGLTRIECIEWVKDAVLQD